MTPAWVGRGRWLLLDLGAVKPDYGPALGGDGVVVPRWGGPAILGRPPATLHPLPPATPTHT